MAADAERVRAALSPTVLCLATPDVDRALERSHVHSLAALVQPFLDHPPADRILVRLPSTYDQTRVDHFPLHLVQRPLPDAPTPPTPATPHVPQNQADRDDLFLDSLGQLVAARADHLVAQSNAEELVVRPAHARADDADEGWRARDPDDVAPWYGLVRDAVCARRDLVPYESFAHPVACLVALSTSHPDPLNALAALWDLTSPAALFAPTSFPPRSGAHEDARHDWVNPDVLRFIVLVHDFGAGGGRQGWEDAQRLHDTVRKTYGVHTALLPLFSAAPTAADPLPPAPEVAALWPTPRVQPAPDEQRLIGLGVDEPESAPAPTAPDAQSTNQPAPTPGHELSATDLAALRAFAREFLVQSLVPFLERQGVVLHEQWQAGRRSIGGRLFNVGRKYFGGSAGNSREGSPAPRIGGKDVYNAVKGYYHHSSPLALARRLADIAFFLSDYKLSHAVYDSVAKDARIDKAWRHHAAALRMQALCSLLLPSAPSSPQSNPEALLAQAAGASAAGGSVADFDALRATVLACDLYRARGPSFAPLAPPALVRAARDAEEVVAAVLLEQAALAELRCATQRGGRRRKFAFWMALAAARYEKCGVKSLSRRCLSQASTLFLPAPLSSSVSSTSADDPPPPTSLADPRLPSSAANADAPPALAQWSAIRTHLHHALARQSYTVGAARASVDNFLALLETGASAEGAGEAPEWLDDFALAWEMLLTHPHAGGEGEEGVILPIRLFDAPRARLGAASAAAAGLSAAAGSGSGSGAQWAELERALLSRAKFDAPRRPAALSYRGGAGAGAEASAEGAEAPVEAVLGEALCLEVPVRNPLEAFLPLGGLAVEVVRAGEGEGGGEDGGGGGEGELEVSAPQDVELAPGETSKILIPIRASALGTYTFRALSYRFNNLVPVREQLDARWSKPSAPAPGKPSVRSPRPLRVRVRPPVPVLAVDLDDFPPKLFHGETREATLTVRNAGSVPLADLHALVSHPDFFLLAPTGTALDDEGALRTANGLAAPAPAALLPAGRTLAPGELLSVRVLARGSHVGAHALQVLFALRAVASGEGQHEYFSTRAVREVEVYPSLEVRYVLRPGRGKEGPLVLGIEVHNAGLPADDVALSGVSLLSPRWRVAPASAGPGAFAEDVAAQRIDWQQGLSVFVPLAVAAAVDDEADLWTVKQVDALLEGKDVKGVPPEAVVGVSSLSASTSSESVISPAALSAVLASYTSYRRASLTERYPTVPAHLHPSLFPLFSSRSAAVILTFTSPTLSLEAAHLLVPLDAPYPGSALGSPAAAALHAVLINAERRSGGLYEESRRERRALLAVLKRSEIIGADGGDSAPIAVDIAVREVVQHDFSSGPLTLPLNFTLSSVSPATTFTYTLSLAPSPARAGIATLAGALMHRGTLAPLARARVAATLWVSRPGVFSAGAYELVITWVGAGGEEGSARVSGGAREVRVRDVPAGRAALPPTPAAAGAVVDIRA